MTKNRHTLLIASLFVFFTLAITGCNFQATKAIQIDPTQVVKTQQSVFVPYLISDNPPAGTPQPYPDPQTITDPGASATPDPSSTPADPTATVKPTKPPTPTLFWPTPANITFATPYARPSGDHGETLPPEKWQEWPVVPVVSARAREIYEAGIAAGRDPKRFSKVGDCQNIRQYFLGMFDTPGTFRLGNQNKNLQSTIDQFSGSWGRLSEAVRTGFNVASVLTPLYANPKNCQAGEYPLHCEIRTWNPSIMIISMETWTAGRPVQAYENYLRQIVESAIAHNVLPILATKADNLEGDNSINLVIARVAHDYDIPLWNFWAAAQPLPDHGLSADGFHLTNGPNFFDTNESNALGWPIRNLTALKAIDAVYNAVK